MVKQKIDYTPKTLENRKQRNKVHPVAAELGKLFIKAIMENPSLFNTAWCIELAVASAGWELDAVAKANIALSGKMSATSKRNMIDLIVGNKIREKIEKDKGVKII